MLFWLGFGREWFMWLVFNMFVDCRCFFIVVVWFVFYWFGVYYLEFGFC